MPYQQPVCEAVPLADHQVSFRVAGHERLRWHFGPSYPRPFLFPLVGPSGEALTRMGHPGAPNHDHHRSIWFAHQNVSGVDFWSDTSPARIRQKQWLCYHDGPTEAAMAVTLGWHDGHQPKELLEQELIVAVRPGPEGETFVELQSSFKPTAESLEFGKTNFGFLAVRVAKSLSEYFGAGLLSDSEGREHEAKIFGQAARWMDYSGPVSASKIEGITYFDHPSNPNHPAKWHVREDGWMGASACLDGPRTTTRAKPLTLRYLLHAHRGPVSAERANALFKEFAAAKEYLLKKPGVKHTAFAIERV
jgi:hypothetical protein